MPYLKIIRPVNCIFVFITVLFGAYFKQKLAFEISAFAAAFSALLIAAAGYVMNDYFDLPIDKINKPHRVLPSKKINPKNVYIYSLFLFILGIILSFLTNSLYCVLIAISNSIILFYYAKYFKLSPALGNIMIAYTSATTFIFGGLSNNNFQNSLLIALFALFYTLIRELTKDCEDVHGDSIFKAKTLAILLGEKKTMILALFPALLMLLTNYFALQKVMISYLSFYLISFIVILPLMFFIILLIINGKKKKFSQFSNMMKIDMFILLLILWFGK